MHISSILSYSPHVCAHVCAHVCDVKKEANDSQITFNI